MNNPALPSALLAAACLALTTCAPGAGGPQAGPGKVVTSLSITDARTGMRQAGLSAPTDMTSDPEFPSVAARQADGFVIQTTLFACEVSNQACRGAEITSVIPSTTLTNAEIIEASIEQTAFGVDAVVVEADIPYGVSRDPQYAVMLSSYLVYDHGVSDSLYLDTLLLMRDYISQTKAFMLSDDPAHAELWARKRL